jgi:hypothetical protein
MTHNLARGSLAYDLDMYIIKIFFTPHMGIKTLTMVGEGKAQPQALKNDWRRETTITGHNNNLLGSSTMNAS